jgi:hypothetical protein
VNGVACGRRVAKLWSGGGIFLCRHCYRLVYGSQREEVWARTVRRSNKVRQRIGGASVLVAPLPPKSKGMWHQTYERMRQRAMRADEAFANQTERLLAQLYTPNCAKPDRGRVTPRRGRRPPARAERHLRL